MTIIVHRIVDGPYEDEEYGYFLVCLLEINGELYTEDVYVETFDEAYGMVKHFSTSIEPIIISS